jgi:hypothetical protein
MASMRHGRVTEFKALLDLLNIKYIFQRNDILSDMLDRNLMSPAEIKNFIEQQSYIHLLHTFGEIDIYEYIDSKPFLYAVSPSTLERTSISIETCTALDKHWNFSLTDAIEDWNSTLFNQSQAGHVMLSQNGTYLKAEMSNSSSGWITVDSPLMSAQYGSNYVVRAVVAGDNTSLVSMRIAEYAENMSLITDAVMIELGRESFDWWNIDFSFQLRSSETKFFSIQFWNYFKINETTYSTLWLDNVKVLGKISKLNLVGLESIFEDSRLDRIVLQAQRLSPTRIVVSVNASEPFILATSEELDEFWAAYINGERIDSTPLYLGLQGFFINKTGHLDISIEYEPQNWFYYASAFSIAALIALIVIFIYYYRTNSVDNNAKDFSHFKNCNSASRLTKLLLWLLLWFKKKFNV